MIKNTRCIVGTLRNHWTQITSAVSRLQRFIHLLTNNFWCVKTLAGN